MSDKREELMDAMDWLLSRFEEDDSVAYAEVGGVHQAKTDIVITSNGPRDTASFTEAGVWCRIFADGAADYRYTTSLDTDSLADIAERAIRAGEVLAQDEPARFDAYTTHRGVHGGWANDGINTVDSETKTAIVEDALSMTEDITLDQTWVNYTDAHIESSLGTTTGSTVQTTLDRAGVMCVLTLDDGLKVRRHVGSTRGTAFLDELSDTFEHVATDTRALAAANPIDMPTGEAAVVLSPRAAGQLFHFVSHYLEKDMEYMGLSPYSVGDQIGPGGLFIEDTIHAGSWAAHAYDAEVRPTTPTQLVTDGKVRRMLHNTVSAAAEETYPTGNAVPSLGFNQPPRIHARHLEIAPGNTSCVELCKEADVYIERFDRPMLRDEFERVQRTGFVPPSILYAKDISRKIEERTKRGHADLPIAEGYRLTGGEQVGRLNGISLAYEPATLHDITGIGDTRGTVTGMCEKHKSRLPYAATAPSIRLQATLRDSC